MSVRRTTLALLVTTCLGCAAHNAPEPLGDRSAPRVGWVIMQGSSDNPDEEFVCQSNPQTPCEVRASTADRKVFSDVHLYFHPIGVETRYEGTRQIEFIGEARPAPVNVTIDANSVGNSSVVGIVTDKPGAYALNVTTSAVTPNGPVQVAHRVPVIVR